MSELGDALNKYQKIQVLRFPDPEELEFVLQSIKQPFSIEAMYFDGINHVAWVIPGLRRIRVDNKEK